MVLTSGVVCSSDHNQQLILSFAAQLSTDDCADISTPPGCETETTNHQPLISEEGTSELCVFTRSVFAALRRRSLQFSLTFTQPVTAGHLLTQSRDCLRGPE